MEGNDLTVDRIIANYGSFFQKFNINKEEISEKYSDWNETNNSKPVSEYLLHLLCKVGVFIAKSANSEEEGLEWRIKLEEKILDYCKVFRISDIGYHEKLLKSDKSRLIKLKEDKL